MRHDPGRAVIDVFNSNVLDGRVRSAKVLEVQMEPRCLKHRMYQVAIKKCRERQRDGYDIRAVEGNIEKKVMDQVDGSNM